MKKIGIVMVAIPLLVLSFVVAWAISMPTPILLPLVAWIVLAVMAIIGMFLAMRD